MVEVIIWMLVAVFLIAIDVITSSFIFMWFSLGALVAIILSLLEAFSFVVILEYFFVNSLFKYLISNLLLAVSLISGTLM